MHQDNAGGSSGIHAICFRRPPSDDDGMAAAGKDCRNIGAHDSTADDHGALLPLHDCILCISEWMAHYRGARLINSAPSHEPHVMPFPLETLIAVPLIGLLAYIILGMYGFGSALVTIPLLVHFLPLQSVVPLVVMVDFLATVSNGVRFREHVEVAALKLLIPAVIAGILSGVTLLATLPKHAALLMLGGFVTGYGVYRLLTKPSARPVSRWWGIPTGLIGGLIGGLFGV